MFRSKKQKKNQNLIIALFFPFIYGWQKQQWSRSQLNSLLFSPSQFILQLSQSANGLCTVPDEASLTQAGHLTWGWTLYKRTLDDEVFIWSLRCELKTVSCGVWKLHVYWLWILSPENLKSYSDHNHPVIQTTTGNKKWKVVTMELLDLQCGSFFESLFQKDWVFYFIFGSSPIMLPRSLQ